MKLSDELQQCHVSGDFGKALEGYSERAKQLEDALKNLVARCESEICDTEDVHEIQWAKQLLSGV